MRTAGLVSRQLDMPYDSAHVVLCRILLLLEAFVRQYRDLHQECMRIEMSVKHQSGVPLPDKHVPTFEGLIQRHTKLVYDLIRDICTPTTPPEVVGVLVSRLSSILINNTNGLASDMTKMLQDPWYRLEVIDQLVYFENGIDYICRRIRCFEPDARERYPTCPDYNISIQDIVRHCSD